MALGRLRRRERPQPCLALCGPFRAPCRGPCAAPCHFAKDNNAFAAFPEIFSEPVFSCSTQYCCIIWSVSSSFFWMRDLATEKGAKERQNLCGWLEISHLEIYPFLCTASCLRVSTPNCYTWVLARRAPGCA